MFSSLQEYLTGLGIPAFFQNLIILLIPVGAGLLMRAVVTWYARHETKKMGNFSFFHSLIQYLNKPLNMLLVMIFIKLTLSELTLSPRWFARADKAVDVIFIACYAWLLIACVKVAREFAVYRYDYSKVKDNAQQRRIRTQFQIIQRIINGAIIFISIAFILLSFDGVRKVGAGMLTGVGIGGIVIGLAAQRPLANIMAGLHIAFTQPIRIDDVLIVENEYGNVEEITLSYVIVRTWDNRRLILPINYFIEKPFQNWTLTSAELLAYVYLYTDYSVPIPAIRDEVEKILPGNKYWNKKVKAVQATDSDKDVVTVRILMSADSASDAFELRCIVREHLLQFISKNYPGSLPRTRIDMQAAASA